ncbi:hypothetical protein [Flavobacterium defluvii]|uniref:Uncharacterized protein n=1 Tax=Flavobacterium defluvii TaxID=370979 RepID=A0A1M5L692_9FLAO|nr:hypothetical protein [Flavobacterium defluvii]SHG60309.1 hypothetical protein SAMN05443663_103279 [Flavobacterium defluvii]
MKKIMFFAVMLFNAFIYCQTFDGNLGSNSLRWNTEQKDFNALPRVGINSMSIKLWDNYAGAGAPSTYGSLLEIYGKYAHLVSQLYFKSTWEGDKIMYRSAFYNQNAWSEWRTLLDSKSDVESSGSLKLQGVGNSYITTGNFGIGTKTPSTSLEVFTPSIVGSEALLKLSISDASQDYIRIVNATGDDNRFIPLLQGYHVTDNRAALYLTGMIETANDSGENPIMVFDSRRNGSVVSTRPLFSWDSYGIRKMILTSNGSLGIGTNTTGNHKLAVEGSIGAREVKVQATGWADFVFKKEYQLPTLEEVEKHIAEKGHLENIPSEEEVLKDGINLGDMNTKLLQKIEELTLYIIKMEKENKKQTTEINNLKKIVLSKKK